MTNFTLKNGCLLYPLAAGILAQPVSAQNNSQDPLAETQKQGVEAAALEKIEDGKATIGGSGPVERAAGAISNSALQFSNIQGESELTLAVKFELDTHQSEPSSRPDEVRRSSFDLVISGTTPLGDPTGSDIFSGGSLVSGSRFKLALTRTISYSNNGSTISPVLDRAVRRCVSQESAAWLSPRSGDDNAVGSVAIYRDRLEGRYGQDLAKDSGARITLTLIDLDQEINNGTEPALLKSLSAAVKGKCAGTIGRQFLKTYFLEDEFDRFVQELRGTKPLEFMGADASLGEENFDVLDLNEFEKTSQSRTSWEAGAYYGRIASDANSSWRARVSYGVGYEGAEESQICRQQDMAMALECLTGPSGPPIRRETGLAQVEYRQLVTLADDQEIGFAPQATYDIDEDEFDFELPIYLAQDDKGKLSGGLRLGYSTRDDDFAVGLFIRSPFSIFF